MAIEKDLKRIADALELIAASMNNSAPAPQASAPAAPAPQASAPAAPAQQQAPAAPTQQQAPAAPTQQQAPAAMTPEQLNAFLVNEFKRIGDRGPIDAAIKEFGAGSVANLTDAAQQQALIAKVQAIPGKA